MPIKVGSEVESALVLSMSIEDLKTTIAHATGYSSRYSLYSMVGETSEFWRCSIRQAALPAPTTTSCCRASPVPASSVWHTAFIRPAPALPLR